MLLRLRSVLALLALLSLALPATTRADDAWRLRGSLALVAPDDGGFEAVRPNGKTVRTEISSGPGLQLELERRLGARFGVVVGYLGRSHHAVEIHQDFPDGTAFRSGDETSFDAVLVGVALHLTTAGRGVDLYLHAQLVRAWFSDLAFAGAGPPWDRSTPLEVDTSPSFGAGVAAGLDWRPRSGRVGLTASLGLLVVGLRGPFVSPPEGDGDAGGDLDLDFNPLVVRIGLSLRL